MRLGLLAVTIAGAVLPRSVGAQAPAVNAALTAWFDSVEAAPAAQLHQLDGASRTGSGAVGEIRRDLYQARAAQVADDRHLLVNTLTALDILADAHPHWAWPPLALANAYADLARAHAPPLNLSDQRLGESHVDALWRYLRDALRDDSELAPARALAIGIMVAGGDRELTSDEHSILATLLLRPDPEADALLVLARDLRRRFKYDSALSVFDASLAAGGDVSRLALEQARTLRALERPGAAEHAYWEGLQRMTPTGREMYHFDLAWILTPDSLAAFERLPDDAVLGWMHRFWDERDAAAANHPGERLLEHLRRWVIAYANFRVNRPWRYTQMTRVEYLFEGFIGPGKGWDRCIASDEALYDLLSHEAPVHPGDIRDREPLLDHRGLIYLKHGQPWRTLNGPTALMAVHDARNLAGGNPVAEAEADAMAPPGNPVAETDSWLYWFEGGWRLLHFRGSNALGMFRPSTLSGYLPITPEMYLARAGMMQEYAAAAHAILHVATNNPLSCLDEVQVAVAKSREDAHTATTSDSDTPIITAPWTSAIQVFALGHGADHTGKLLLSFAFSGASLVGYPGGNGRVRFPLHVRIVAYNRATGESVALDTTRVMTNQGPLGPNRSLTGWFEMPLGGGTWQVALRANEGVDSAGAYMLHRDLVVDAAPGLSLSDIVTGRDGAGSWTATDGMPFPLNVLDAWTAGGTARLFYEVRGLEAGEEYQTLVELTPVGDTRRTIVRFVTVDRATGPVDHVRKSLGLEQLRPGRYRLTVTVSHGNGSAARSRDLVIGKP